MYLEIHLLVDQPTSVCWFVGLETTKDVVWTQADTSAGHSFKSQRHIKAQKSCSSDAFIPVEPDSLADPSDH